MLFPVIRGVIVPEPPGTVPGVRPERGADAPCWSLRQVLSCLCIYSSLADMVGAILFRVSDEWGIFMVTQFVDWLKTLILARSFLGRLFIDALVMAVAYKASYAGIVLYAECIRRFGLHCGYSY